VVGGGGGRKDGGRGRDKLLVLIGGFGRQGAKENEVWGLKLSDDNGGSGERFENGWVRLVPASSAVDSGKEEEEEGTPSRSRSTSGGLPARWHHVAVPVNTPATTTTTTSSSSFSSSSSEEGRGRKDAVVIVGGSDEVGKDHNEALLVEIDWQEGTYTWRALATEAEKEGSRPPVRQ